MRGTQDRYLVGLPVCAFGGTVTRLPYKEKAEGSIPSRRTNLVLFGGAVPGPYNPLEHWISVGLEFNSLQDHQILCYFWSIP